MVVLLLVFRNAPKPITTRTPAHISTSGQMWVCLRPTYWLPWGGLLASGEGVFGA